MLSTLAVTALKNGIIRNHLPRLQADGAWCIPPVQPRDHLEVFGGLPFRRGPTRMPYRRPEKRLTGELRDVRFIPAKGVYVESI